MHYTPPAHVRTLMNDLALLPAWYADPGDYVLVDAPAPQPPFDNCPPALRLRATPVTRQEIKAGATLPRLEAAPWGLSPQSVRLFDDLRREGLPVDGPIWKDEYTALTSRRTAAACLAEIQRLLPGFAFPAPPVFFSQPDDIDAWLSRHTGPFVLKAPYSSSGRGLIWLNGPPDAAGRNRIRGLLRRQGAVSIEQALDKVTDFAMEFYTDGQGALRYEGLSLFSTNKQGAYRGNKLQTQSALRQQLSNYAGEDRLDAIQQTLSRVLGDTFAGRYAGYLGVDMLIYNDRGSFAIHPCVEINLRYTMGLTAIRLFENYLDQGAEASLHILYDRHPGHSLERHLLMSATHPPAFRNGRLLRGYLSLCPVTPRTHYTASILAT
jgi:hypothetical protein